MTTAEKMRSSGAAYRYQAIMSCFNSNYATEEEIKELKKLKTDSVIIAGRPISAYATAVLDRLGIEKYEGDDRQTLDLIAGM